MVVVFLLTQNREHKGSMLIARSGHARRRIRPGKPGSRVLLRRVLGASGSIDL
jgi:hypothetical protein